ncbi:MAG: 30S ribosomal protein S8 [bacterium]
MMTDPIADMLTRVRNASMINKREVCIPFSKIKKSIADILVGNGYLKNVEKKNDATHPYLLVTLKYNNKEPAVSHIKRISKPGRRVYVKNDEIKQVLSGIGISIISTPKGLMTNQEARKMKMGGEIICEIY